MILLLEMVWKFLVKSWFRSCRALQLTSVPTERCSQQRPLLGPQDGPSCGPLGPESLDTWQETRWVGHGVRAASTSRSPGAGGWDRSRQAGPWADLWHLSGLSHTWQSPSPLLLLLGFQLRSEWGFICMVGRPSV